MEIPFKAGDIWIPKKNINMTKWSVVACDQYTSEPEYWNEVNNIVGNEPSTLNITLPEIYFRYDQACQARQKLKDNNIAMSVNIINA